MSTWRRPLLFRCGALVAVALVAASCAPESGGASTGAQGPNPRAAIQELLRRRVAALNAGDVDGYLSPLLAEAREFEEPVARGALTVPLQRVDMTIGNALISDDGTTVEGAAVELRFRYEGLPDDNIFRICLLYDLELREGDWVVVSSGFDEERYMFGQCSHRPLWAHGDVEVTRSDHFLVLARPGLAGLARVVARAEEARSRLLEHLPLEPDPVHLMTLVDNDEASGIGGVSWTLQESAAYPLRPEDREAIFNAVFLQSDDLATGAHLGGLDATEVLHHQLGHLTLSRYQRNTDPWASEAATMVLAGERREPGWQALASDPDRLARQSVFPPLELQDDNEEFAFYNAAGLMLVEIGGADTLYDLFQNFKELIDEPAAPQSRSGGTERLLRRYYGFGVDELDERTREWIRSEVG